jgi:hypothetical protein
MLNLESSCFLVLLLFAFYNLLNIAVIAIVNYLAVNKELDYKLIKVNRGDKTFSARGRFIQKEIDVVHGLCFMIHDASRFYLDTNFSIMATRPCR